ncbi:MAG TPA: FUSC family protein [Bryobacteraceae bacterium]|nr:FUSC family protein [Bryobacteraceae bacterium]
MATLAQRMGAMGDSPPEGWFWEFLKAELAPYPGRVATVGRMVLAATLVALICEIFRIPFAFQGTIFTLLISRESPQATVRSAGTIFLVTGMGAAYVLIGAWFVINIPWLHFLWNICSLFLAFFVIAALTNYTAAVIFAVLVAIGIPLWDSLVPAETNVELTLWVVLEGAIGVSVSMAIELAFARTRHGDDIVLPIARRLAAVRNVLAACAEGGARNHAAKVDIVRQRVLGTSLLRRFLHRSTYSPLYRAQMSGVAGLTGRLVDIAAALADIPRQASGAVASRARNLAASIGRISDDLLQQRIPQPVQFEGDSDTSSEASLLGEMEDSVSLIPQAFAGSHAIDEYEVSADDLPRPMLFGASAFSNPANYRFALRGCLAAGGAYVIYHAIDWPGLSTSVSTCLLTALSTMGASRQKQFLRLVGFLIGGILGIGVQIFVLPSLDSIAGFMVVFVPVTLFSAWIMTSGPRLSYLGLQAALGFYLIHLQESAPQLSLSVARDRLVGILLGLFMMWLVFDHLWTAPAAVEMKTAFLAGIRLLAQLTREPSSSEIRAAIKRSHVLSEMLNAQWDKVRSLADGVLFEFGPSRPYGLALRSRVRRWQPRLRALFLMRRASLRFSLGLQGFELPEAGRRTLRQYNERSARMLDEMADRLEGRMNEPMPEPDGDEQFVDQVLAACGCEARELPPQMRSFGILLRRIDGVTRSLAEEVRAA